MVKRAGFSLIELTVVIGLLSLLVLTITSTMLMSMVSSNRIRTATKIKQAGNYALGEIQFLLRNSKSITTCDSSSATISFIGQDGGSTEILLESDRLASNSGVYLTPDSATVSNYVLSCSPSDTEPSVVKVSFDLKSSVSTTRASENPLLHFETSISLRNQ